jgi:hypothetical protein
VVAESRCSKQETIREGESPASIGVEGIRSFGFFCASFSVLLLRNETDKTKTESKDR